MKASPFSRAVAAKRAMVLGILALALCPAPVMAWGKTGHRVVAQIADAHLTGKARAGVKRILGRETLAEASNWPDFMKSDPAPYWQKTASAWHYVTVPAATIPISPP